MTLRRTAKGYAIGDGPEDLRAELVHYADHGPGSYLPTRFADAVCGACGGREFLLLLDENAGVALRVCGACGGEHVVGDGEDFLDDAELEQVECLCGVPLFEITVGVSLYADSDDVRWLYLGCRCPACGVVGCYGDWKNELTDFRALLARV